MNKHSTWKYALSILALCCMGAGCIDITVLEVDKNAVPSVQASPFAENAIMSVAKVEVAVDEVEYPVTIFRLKKGSVALTLTRPETSDTSIHLSVAGTYTSPSDKPEGFIVLSGEIIQMRERMAWNGAAFFRDDGSLAIFATNNGKLLTKAYMETVAKDKASLIQGHLLVSDGVVEKLLPQTPYQRRALVTFADQSIAVVETTDIMDLQTFAKILVALDVKDALNLDMGQWSEGWYRDPISGQTRNIGYLTSATHKQSNWIVFKE